MRRIIEEIKEAYSFELYYARSCGRSRPYFAIFFIKELYYNAKFAVGSIICKYKGHKWEDVDTGDVENGPCFHGTCSRCMYSI